MCIVTMANETKRNHNEIIEYQKSMLSLIEWAKKEIESKRRPESLSGWKPSKQQRRQMRKNAIKNA